jgi:hypothetical protein
MTARSIAVRGLAGCSTSITKERRDACRPSKWILRDGEDEGFAHEANRTMTASARKTAPHRRIPSYCPDSVPVRDDAFIGRAARLAGEHLRRLRHQFRFGYADTVRLEIHVYTFLRAPILFAELSGRSFSAGRIEKCRRMRPRLREHPNADDSGM